MLSLLRQKFQSNPPLLPLIIGGFVLVAAPLVAAAYDWRQATLGRDLAAEVARVAAEAGAANFEDARRAARHAADVMAPQRFTIELTVGRMDEKKQPPAFTETDEEASVVRVVATGRARLTFGRLIGLSSWPVEATALAERTGLAAITVRSQASPTLIGLSQAVERQLVGDGWALSVDDRRALSGAVISLSAVIAALNQHLPEAAKDFPGTTVAVAELLAIVSDLIDRPESRTSQDARAAAILSRLSQVSGTGVDVRLGSVFGFAEGFDPLDNELPQRALDVRLIDLVQSVMRARLVEHPVSIALDQPVEGIAALTVEVSAREGTVADAASIRVGTNDSVIRTLPLRVALRARIGGIAIGEVRQFVLPWDVTVNAGDAVISAIQCTGPVSAVEVKGRPVRVVASIFRPKDAEGSAATGFVPLLSEPGLMVWAKGSVAFASDPPVVQTVVANAAGSEVFRLRAPIDLANRLDKLANESSIVVSLDGTAGMTEGGVRSEIVQAIKDRLPALTEVFLSVFASFGITPGQLEVAVSAASCAYARPLD